MSLQNIKTGETATPLAQLQKNNEILVEKTENALLKEALAISNEKCNALIEQQNSLIKELTQEVSNLKNENSRLVKQLQQQTDKVTSELQQVVLDERNFRAEISRNLKEDLAVSANEITAYYKEQVDKSIAPVNKELKEVKAEIAEQTYQMRLRGKVRNILFWATPVLLLVQSFISILLLLK